MNFPSGAAVKAQVEFQQLGRVFHLRIRDASDLPHILDLDEAHWIATSAPIQSINADPGLLNHLDSDADGRVQVKDVREAVAWLLDHVGGIERICMGDTSFEPAHVRKTAPEGPAILAAAAKLCHRIGCNTFGLGDVRRTIGEAVQRSGDIRGTVLPRAAADETVRQFMLDVAQTTGGATHPGGEQGVTAASVERFLKEARDFLRWQDSAALGDRQAELMPLGNNTPEAYQIYTGLRSKIDQYFALCNLARIDAFIAQRVEPSKLHPDAFEFSQADAIESVVANAPIAAPNPKAELHFDRPLNPSYAELLETFRVRFLEPLAGEKDMLSQNGWHRVKTALEPFESWQVTRPQVCVDSLPLPRLRSYVSDPRCAESVRRLIAQREREDFVMDNLRLLEKFILFRAYLLTFVNSFVSFPDLYDPSRRALFEMGTLIMDGRHFTLSVRVSDRTHHAKLSAASNIFVLYVEVNADDTSYELAVAVTSGGQGKLAVGKEGIFHDVYGRELRARVVHIVENPVCLREEVLAPFKRLSRAYNTWIENITTQAEENLAGTSKSAVTLISKRLKTDSAAAPNAGAGVAGLLTGGGIAVAALGSSAAFITKTLAALSWQAVLGGILAMLLALMLPTAWLAYSRLRHRDLSAMLEGAGWAINARMWLTWSQAAKFTFQPTHGTGLRRLRFCLRRWFSY